MDRVKTLTNFTREQLEILYYMEKKETLSLRKSLEELKIKYLELYEEAELKKNSPMDAVTY